MSVGQRGSSEGQQRHQIDKGRDYYILDNLISLWPDMPMIYIYLRVSSRQQDTAAQTPELQRWQAGCTQPVEWVEEKHTGTTMDRPQWQRIYQQFKQGDTVVVWRLDRLGRTASGLTKLFDDLSARKINLISIREGIDLATAAGRLVANVLASVAQFETEVRRERMAAGIAAAKAKGKRWGGSSKGREIKTRATPEQRQQIRQLHEQGKGKSAIARATGLSRPTVYSYLQSA